MLFPKVQELKGDPKKWAVGLNHAEGSTSNAAHH